MAAGGWAALSLARGSVITQHCNPVVQSERNAGVGADNVLVKQFIQLGVNTNKTSEFALTENLMGRVRKTINNTQGRFLTE